MPVVFRAGNTAIPILMPLAYNVLKIKDKAFKTRRAHVSAIDELYEFFELKGLELDEALINGQFYLLFDHLNEFFMIHLYRQKTKPTSNQVVLVKVSFIKEYLKWAFARFIHRQVAFEKKEKIETNLMLRLTTFFESLPCPTSFKRKNYKSLSEKEVDYMLDLIHPDSEYNPFQDHHRLRNYIIVKLFLSTGIRLGEILLLKSTSILYSEDSYYIKIMFSPDATDTRADRPDIKNTQSERIVAITKELYELCNYYILHLRRLTRNGKRMKLSHGFLFTSELGKPLSKTSISDIFGKINSALLAQNKPISLTISPHILRHSFADSFLQYLIEVRKLDMERAKDELRTVCGWSINSSMPVHYASRYISRMANQHNLARLATTFTFYEPRQTTSN